MTNQLIKNIINLCFSIDTIAQDVYQKLMQKEDKTELKEFWRHMAAEETEHLKYWKNLQDFADRKYIPRIFDHPEEIERDLENIFSFLKDLQRKIDSILQKSDFFYIALRLEFYLLHPAFTAFSRQLQYKGNRDANSLQQYENRISNLLATVKKYRQDDLGLDILGEIFNWLLIENEHLLRQIEAKNKILGIAAHDIRHPISYINMGAQFLLQNMSGNLDEKQKDIMGKIVHKTEDSLAILNDTLDLEAVDLGRINLKIEVDDYIAFLKQNIEENRIFAKSKGIRIKLIISEKPGPVRFDRIRMEQVLNNLLSNSIKYSDPNTSIRVWTGFEEGISKTEITDQGYGIPENELSMVFNEYQRANMPHREKGTGLGLAIVKGSVNCFSHILLS